MESKKIGAIWVKTREDGSRLSSGVIKHNGEKLLINIFPNDYKEEGDKQPNYNIVLWKVEKDETCQPSEQEDDSDIPFG